MIIRNVILAASVVGAAVGTPTAALLATVNPTPSTPPGQIIVGGGVVAFVISIPALIRGLRAWDKFVSTLERIEKNTADTLEEIRKRDKK